MAKKLAIRHGIVHDGERFVGPRDIILEGDAISVVGAPGMGHADEEIDATGCVVAPGFIDVHDMTFKAEQLDGNDAINLTAQGITTCIIGNCGNSGVWEDRAAALRQIDLLRSAALGINVGNLVGHNSLRQFVLGGESARAATTDEVAEMVSLLEEAMEHGALGLSSGLMYAPGTFASRDELVALVSAVGKRGKMYATHVRDEGDGFEAAIHEALDVAASGNASLLISHYKVAGIRNWGKTKETTRLIEGRRTVQDIKVSFYLYDSTSTVLRADLPPPIVRKSGGNYMHLVYSAEDEVLVETQGLQTLCQDGWNDVIIVSSAVPGIVGRSVATLAEGRSCYQAVLEILHQDEDTRVIYRHVASDEELLTVAQLPYAMPCSDGYVYATGDHTATHPRNYGAFARVLRVCVTERGLFSVEEFVRRACSLPAATFGIPRRGRIQEGYFADLVVFRPEEVRDMANYEQPYLISTGVRYTVVNGQIVFIDGGAAESFPGRYLTS